MTPDKVQARKMVLVGVLVLALVTVYRDRGKQGPQGTFRTFWGVGVVGMFLSLLADFLPQIAGPFAGLIVLGSLTHGGDRILEGALGALAPAPSSPGSGSGSSSPPGPSAGTSSSPATAQTVMQPRSGR